MSVVKMAQVRAQVVLQGGSGLPEDQFVNVFHFVTAGSYDADAAAVAAALITRYQAIQAYLSEYVLPAASIKTYDMSVAATPREPTVFPMALTIQTTALSLPNEVAVCLSFHGSPPNVASRRGRVYLGPWNVNIMDAATTTAPPRPHDGFLTQIRMFGQNLLAANLGWSIWSPTNGIYVTVLGGFVDNEFDTMRSRGCDSTSRQLYPV